MTVLQWNVVKRTAFTCKVAVYSIDTGSLLLLQLIILIKTKSSKAMEFLVFSKWKIQKFVKCLNNFFLRYVSRWSKKKNTLHLTNTRWADLKSFAWNVDTRLVRLSVGLGLLFCRICHRFVSALEWLSMATVHTVTTASSSMHLITVVWIVQWSLWIHTPCRAVHIHPLLWTVCDTLHF